jgi:hypothetical protein
VEGLLSRMEPSERLGFLIRLARATPTEEYRSGIEWYLKEQLGLEGAVLRRVSSLCLE